jgi:hypothetical protein
MRIGLIAVLVVLAAALAPAVAAAAQPVTWPSAADVLASTPTLGAKDASCIAGYYDRRLSRAAWYTPYYALTARQKLVTDKGFEHCMTLAERTALIAHEDTRSLGKHTAEIGCSARAMARRTSAHLLSITSRAQAIADNDAVYRSCKLIGAVYASLARSTELRLTPAEQACANRAGSADPLRSRAKQPTVKQRTAIGKVFDACVGRASEQAMWERLLKDFRPARAVDCIARRSVAITFVTFFGSRSGLQRATKQAAAHCVLAATGGS